MRKTFLKTLVATAVVGATVALGSVFTFAATVHQFDYTTLDYVENNTTPADGAIDSYFAFSGSTDVKVKTENKDGVKKVLGIELNKSGKTVLSFTAENDGVARVWVGSTGSTATSAVTVKNSTTSNTIVDNRSVSGTTSADNRAANEFSFDIEAGNTYQIYESGGNKGLRVYALTVVDGALESGLTTTPCGAVYVSGDDVYAIAGVSADTVADESVEKVTLKIGKGGSYSSDTVYTELTDGDVTVKASDLGADYLYAIKLTGAKADGNSATFTVKAE